MQPLKGQEKQTKDRDQEAILEEGEMCYSDHTGGGNGDGLMKNIQDAWVVSI